MSMTKEKFSKLEDRITSYSFWTTDKTDYTHTHTHTEALFLCQGTNSTNICSKYTHKILTVGQALGKLSRVPLWKGLVNYNLIIIALKSLRSTFSEKVRFDNSLLFSRNNFNYAIKEENNNLIEIDNNQACKYSWIHSHNLYLYPTTSRWQLQALIQIKTSGFQLKG